jgi:hypothetical protein
VSTLFKKLQKIFSFFVKFFAQLKRKSAPFGVEIIFLRLCSPFQAKNNKKSLAIEKK